jgi:class 3 adenylate cyclase
MNSEIDIRHVLPTVRVPTLVIHRTDDTAIKVAAGRQLAQLIPEARYVDRVLATVLFIDIVGSTQQLAQMGDRRWHHLLDAHHGIVRQELARFRGRLIDTAGDGLFASFDGPARAIRSAYAIRDAVRALGIETRAGLHTGECEVMGDKVGGLAVHIGARVMATAAAGEVLVSNTVKDLVAGAGIDFEPRSQHQLKGVPGEWPLYAVRAVGGARS